MSYFVPRSFIKTTEEEIEFVAKFYGWTKEEAKQRLVNTPKENKCGNWRYGLFSRQENLRAFESVKASTPNEESLDKARKSKYKPIIIKSKDE